MNDSYEWTEGSSLLEIIKTLKRSSEKYKPDIHIHIHALIQPNETWKIKGLNFENNGGKEKRYKNYVPLPHYEQEAGEELTESLCGERTYTQWNICKKYIRKYFPIKTTESLLPTDLHNKGGWRQFFRVKEIQIETWS